MILLQEIINPILRGQHNLYEEWMLLVIFSILILLAYVRVTYQKRLELLWSSLLRFQIVRQLMREELVFSHRASVLLALIFFITAGYLLYLLDTILNLNFFTVEGGTLFIVYTIIVMGVYLIKALIVNFIRLLIDDNSVLREYLYEVFLVNKALGLAFIPIALLMTFVNISNMHYLIYFLSALIILSFIYRTIRGLQIAFSYNVSKLYIILYICTLEILPIIIMYRALFWENPL